MSKLKVKDRDNNIFDFDINRIKEAIISAFKSTKELDLVKISDKNNYIDVIVEKVKTKLCPNNNIINIEDIQDSIENTLMDLKLYKTAKSFILYREEHKLARYTEGRVEYMDKYIFSKDNAATSSETDANANVTMKNVANLEGEVHKLSNRLIQRRDMKRALKKLFPEVAKQYKRDLENHIIYAHDEAQTPTPKAYCMAVTLYPLLTEGTGSIDGVTPSEPNDIISFNGQVTNLMFLLSSQVRGAVAMGDYIVALNYCIIKEFGEDWYKRLSEQVYYRKNEILSIYDMIRKGMKAFIFGINQPAGNRSYNSPFSNLNFFDKYYYEALFGEFYYPDNTQPKWEAIDILQRMFMELLRELRLIKPLTFPVTSVCMLHDNNKCLDDNCRQWVADEWAKGSSFFLYLSNNPTSISSCCRVQNEITENTFNSTTGLTGIMTGSSNVITLNLNRITQDYFKTIDTNYFGASGIIYKDITEEDMNGFKKYLIDILERVYKYQIAYKTMLYELEEAGMYSSSNAGYIAIKKLYCTIGVIGYCEAAEFLGLKINNNKEYKDFLKFIFGTIQEQNKLHSINDKKRPFIFNLEAIPGENLAVKFYEQDKKDGYYVPKDQNLYSSYFFKQWDKDISILDKLKLHNRDVNTYCGGGQACHLHLDEHLSKEQYLKMIDFAVKEGCNYFTFNIPISECKDCGHIVNAPIKECPICHSKNIDWWVRIIGFLRPLSAYSKARLIEALKRVYSNGKEEIK